MAKSKTEKSKGGRPPKWSDPDKMAKAVEEYFSTCDANVVHRTIVKKDKEKGEYLLEIDIPKPLPYTISGLARALGFSTTESLTENEKRDEFSDIIKRARLRIQEQDETTMKQGEIKNLAGIIFLSKVRYGWKDKQEVEHSGSVTLNFGKEWEQV